MLTRKGMWINRKTGKTRFANMSVKKADGHGWSPYEEPGEPVKIVKENPKPETPKKAEPAKETEHESDDGNDALKPAQAEKLTAKKTGRKQVKRKTTTKTKEESDAK